MSQLVALIQCQRDGWSCGVTAAVTVTLVALPCVRVRHKQKTREDKPGKRAARLDTSGIKHAPDTPLEMDDTPITLFRATEDTFTARTSSTKTVPVYL